MAKNNNYIRALILAGFLKFPVEIMQKRMMDILKPALLTLLMGLAQLGSAQWDDWGGSGDGGTDTAVADSAESSESSGGWGDVGGWGDKKEEAKMPERKPWVRFVPPYDSMREIIYYEGIIEDENCDYCMADSLYWRAKKYVLKRFGKDQLKKFTVEDIKSERLTLKITIPMVVQYGDYRKFEAGFLEYKVTLRFKDYRYKYQYGNFVHIQSPDGLAKESTRTYHEYYMRVKKGYQNTDHFLLAADREVKTFVEGLKKSLKEPYQPDEDDW